MNTIESQNGEGREVLNSLLEQIKELLKEGKIADELSPRGGGWFSRTNGYIQMFVNEFSRKNEDIAANIETSTKYIEVLKKEIEKIRNPEPVEEVAPIGEGFQNW